MNDTASLSTTSIIAIVIAFAVTFGVAVPLMLAAYFGWKKEADLWRKLATRYGVMSYRPPPAPATLDPIALTRAVELAIDTIIALGPWDRMKVLNTAPVLRIELNAVDEWITLAGQHVGGQSIPTAGIVRIGPKFLALAHEICHVLEALLDEKVDLLHNTWAARGLFKVADTYEAKVQA